MPNNRLPFGPIEVFYSYSHKDEELRRRLQTQLKPLERNGLITSWHDRLILAGTKWRKEINEHINSAGVILLLVSPEFIESDYAYGIEMERALERERAEDAIVIPVILSTVDWQDTPLGELQALPTDGKPVDTWDNPNQALYNVAQGIKNRIKSHPPNPWARRPLLFGEVVKLKHRDTRSWLHSHETKYTHEGGSGQEEVVAIAGTNQNDYWLVKGPHGSPPDYRQGEVVHLGDIIRLEHLRTGRNLHSHKERAPLSSEQHEVSCFRSGDEWGIGDFNDNWRVEEIDGGGQVWRWSSAVKLAHEATGWVLHSHKNEYRGGQQEVTCFSGRDNNDWWLLSH
jgi:TIR domain/MIR domain